MFKTMKRTGLACIVLQFCWYGAAAQDSSPERSGPPPTPASSSPIPSTESTRPVFPVPQTPADPLGTLKPAAEPAVTTSVAHAPAIVAPDPVPPAIGQRSIAGPLQGAPNATGAPAKPPVGVEIQSPAAGHDLDTIKRSTPAVVGSSASLLFRSLKRLSPPEILATSAGAFSVYVLRDSERTLVLDFPNTREQAKMFARLILFIERSGASKTRVMTVQEAQKWLRDNTQQFDTMTVGNNMRTGELARFFNSARFQGEPITVDEQKLYDWLLQWQLLREEEAGVSVVEPERILVSVPQVSSVPGCNGCTVSAAQRAVILQHELSHARFATDTVYQNYSVWFWSNALSLVQRDKFTRFLRSRGYDTSIRELCANEMQAFLMNTPDPHMFSAPDIGATDAELADMRRRFIEGIAPKPRVAIDRSYQFE